MHSQKSQKPRPSAWPTRDCITWLNMNISSNDDLIYAQNSILTYIEKYNIAVKKVDNSLSPREMCLYRLYEAFFDQELVGAFYNRNDGWDRSQIDAKNSDMLPPNYWELASEKYNTDVWIPHSRKFPNFHHFYRESVELPLLDRLNMTPDLAKKEFMKVRARVLVVSMYNPYGTPMFIMFMYIT